MQILTKIYKIRGFLGLFWGDLFRDGLLEMDNFWVD
jgi:hypothetical protein